MTAENGSALGFTRAGQGRMGRPVNAYVRAAEEFGWEEERTPSDPAQAFRTVVRREPIGVVAAVIPWNSPLSAALAKVVPALLAGNTVVLKVSPENSLSMALFADLVDRLGLPESVMSVLPADRETSEHIVANPGVDEISFTGSTRAGRRIAAIAGEQLKRVSLEPGGKSAAVLLDDVDLRAEYGLSGGVWSADEARAVAVARRLRTGTVGVNGRPITFDGPFGGRKSSGLGREYGAAGLATYVELMTMTV
ncbi:aldehyde dehydrogenase family protein [Actinoallomurus iriomotensis]|nr:aldehyde dehydrogenase family protein [Actinoallomurus iriomotensis]